MTLKSVLGVVIGCVMLTGLWGCQGEGGAGGDARASQARSEGWIDLIQADLGNWQPRATDRPMSWKLADGVLMNDPPEGQKGVDLCTKEKFQDFEVTYEYRVPGHSNSGFYLRGRYEIQIVDDYGKQPDKGTNGALYSVASPAENASRPPGEWQSVHARIVGKTVMVTLNGKTIIDNVEVPRPTGGHLDDNVDEPGPIMLQGDHGRVEFRNIRIRPIQRA